MDGYRWVTLKDGRRVRIDTSKYMNSKIRQMGLKKKKEEQIPDENLGISYGDGGKGRDTFYGEIDGSRGTGHFGTGTYFVSPEGLVGDTYKQRPAFKIDFSEYDNLYKPDDKNDAFNLHDYLKDINRGVEKLNQDDYWNLFSIKSDYDDDYDYYSNTFKKLKSAGLNPMTYDEYKNDSYYSNYGKGYGNYLDEVKDDAINLQDSMKNNAFRVEELQFRLKGIKKEQIDKAYEEVRKAKERYSKMSFDEKRKQDSLSTVFMKALGYNGIDVRFIPELDNSTYGSVIYDLNKKRK